MKRTSPPRALDRLAKQLRRYAPLFFFPTAAAYLVVFAYPFLRGVYLSLCEFRTATDATFVGFRNYAEALSDRAFLYSFGLTALFALVTVVFVNVLAFAVAYALTRRIRFANAFRTVFFLPNLIGGIVLGYIWQLLINGVLEKMVGEDLSYRSTYGLVGLVLLVLWQQIGYMMILYIAALQTVPDSLIEASRIDGAGGWGTLRHVILPTVRPTITICTFLTLTNSFKLYDQNEALTAGRPIEILADGSQFKTTSLIAKNIVDSFTETYARAGGVAQAKAVLFFLAVAAVSLLQLIATKRGEADA